MPPSPADPQDEADRRAGRVAFLHGFREPGDVLRAYLANARGLVGDLHFSTGYREAAAEAGHPVGPALDYLPVWQGALPLTKQVRILEIIHEEAARRGDGAVARCQLDRARAALALEINARTRHGEGEK